MTTSAPALYQKVADDLRAAIVAGEYPAGTRLPSESDLAGRYSVSRGTVRQAFAALRGRRGLPARGLADPGRRRDRTGAAAHVVDSVAELPALLA